MWKGAALVPFAVSVGVGLVLNFLVPRPEAVVPQAWALLSIFLSTTTGRAPRCQSGVGLHSVDHGGGDGDSEFAAFSAMTNDVIWLIVLAFFFARGFVRTGLADAWRRCSMARPASRRSACPTV